MFGNFAKDFEEDPFFGGLPSHFSGLDVVGKDRKHDRQIRERDPFQSLFGDMNKFMTGMHERMSSLKDDPNSYSFSSSSVMSYQNDGKSEPKIYQASSSTRRAPGQRALTDELQSRTTKLCQTFYKIKETRKTLRNSETGVEKMAIGQHLGGKGRVVEQRRHGGRNIEEERQYIEMDEADNNDFDKEWKERTSKLSIPSFERTGIGSSQYHSKPVKQRQIQHTSHGARAVRPHGPSKTGRHKL